MSFFKLFFIFSIFFCNHTWASSNKDEKIKVSIIKYNKHTFLYFNDSQIVHDPDCRCSLRWEGFIKNKNTELPEIELYRSRVSDHD